MSIYIKRKSIVPIPSEGMICDTTNVTNESTNAPSIRLARQLMGMPEGTIIAYDGEETPEGFDEVSLSEVLWENPEPWQLYFSSTEDIILPDNNYEYFRIIALHNSRYLIFDIIPGQVTPMCYVDYEIRDSISKIILYRRECHCDSNTVISFAYCNYYVEGNENYVGNQYLKPVKIIGYNLGTLGGVV